MQQCDEIITHLLVNEWVNDDLGPNVSKFKRAPKSKVDYWQTTWGRWLRDPKIHDPTSKIAKIFMLRFRVPFILFNEHIVKMCEKDDIFDSFLDYFCQY